MTTAQRLARETSPYLLQHAGNPVDWWPWGDEAFAEAVRRDVPVLISVGYSACHWCHVMAHESFEDGEVADVLNAGYVAIKVDREERPDIDAVYMEAVQLLTGTGGWPMTVLATPQRKPFWAGTYLPKANLLRALEQVSLLWTSQRGSIEGDAAHLVKAVQDGSVLPQADGELADSLTGESPTGESPTGDRPTDVGPTGDGPTVLARTAKALLDRQDSEWGGSSGAPKFPQPTTLEALARYWWRSGDRNALQALTRTLDAMSSGGIYDHLAGGFARYSTDKRWLVPHFEKMLYDNALLTRAYTHAWQLTGSARYQQVVHETVGYLLSRPMRLAEGAWASAEDADSEGVEGRFYTWSWSELVDVAGEEVARWYGATPEGNWGGDHGPADVEGRSTNILWRPSIGEIGRPPAVEGARKALLEWRDRRPRPGLDDKVLTEWNAMAVAALAGAATAFSQPGWAAAASQTGQVLLDNLRLSDGRWMRSWRPGRPARHLAFAGDYAWLVEAFTRLAEATGQRSWVGHARTTADALLELFWDGAEGGFFTSGEDGEPLVARLKDLFDGAVPSANAAAAGSLARLGELTGEQRYTQAGLRVTQVMATALRRAPAAFAGAALVTDYVSNPRRQVVVSSSSPELVRPVWGRYLPDTVLAWGEPWPCPLWEGRDGPEAAEQAFVCRDGTCRLPVRTPARVSALLDAGSGKGALRPSTDGAPGPGSMVGSANNFFPGGGEVSTPPA